MLIQYFKYAYLCIFLLFATVSCQTGGESKSIYVVRHAEKQLDNEDPELTTVGEERAKKLGELMTDKNISFIYSTNTIRTKASVNHVAESQDVEIELYDVQDHDELVERLKSKSGNALVVGHSNTIHHVLNYFSEEPIYKELEDSEYDFIFEINIGRDGSSQIIRKSYQEFD